MIKKLVGNVVFVKQCVKCAPNEFVATNKSACI